MLKEAAGDKYLEEGRNQGDRYFNIPVLERTRGISHFYLENFNTGNFEADRAYVEQFAQKVVDAYIGITVQALQHNISYTQKQRDKQIDYHTLYLFQVLTLDRGTTSGLLVHEQNDVGIMGSIPSHINCELLASWVEKMPKPQDELLTALLKALPKEVPTPVEVETKKKLANAVRMHYTKYPEALNMQASGNSVPPTVANHS
jgi:coproporphyrinogen III oxidase